MNKEKYQILCAALLVMAGIAGIVSKVWLRPYIHAAGIEDFGGWHASGLP